MKPPGGGGMNMGGGINPGGKEVLLGSNGSGGGNRIGEEVSWINGDSVSPPFISSTPVI